MQVVQWDPEQSAPLAELFNQLEADVPYQRPVDSESFVASISEPTEHLDGEILLVAVESGQPRGYIHAGVILNDETPAKRGAIRSLAFPRDQRRVGQVLLDSVDEYLENSGVGTFQAFTGRFGYQCTWYGSLKSPWEHVYALLGMNGYRVDGEYGLVAAWPNYVVREPTLPDRDLEVKLEHVPIYPNTRTYGDVPMVAVRVFRKGKQIGVNETRPYYLPCWGRAPQDVCYTGGMVVDESERGRGIGRYILQRGLFEMYRHGCRHALLDLQADNYSALMFYMSLGYRVAYRLSHMVRHSVEFCVKRLQKYQ